ncbi:MAG TPA: MerR family transcriptional regulator [Polyangiaceae bacterium]|jgi:DNA-binding transcriptional MerR regulator
MRLLTPDQMLAESGLPERTLRHWTRYGVVPSFRSADGTDGFTEFHLLRVRAAFVMQAQGVRRLDAIAARLDAMSEAELRELVGQGSPEGGLAADGGLEGQDAAAALHEPAVGAIPVAAPPPAPTQGGKLARDALLAEDHAMLQLSDGLLLLVRRPADESTRALVRSIAALCGRGDVLL